VAAGLDGELLTHPLYKVWTGLEPSGSGAQSGGKQRRGVSVVAEELRGRGKGQGANRSS
jgi:hypothetical protein